MAFRSLKVESVCADSANLDNLSYFRKAYVEQIQDLKTYVTTLRVAPGASEFTVEFDDNITTGYYLECRSTYPIIVRVNSSATLYTLKSNTVPAKNTGAPAQDQCIFIMTGLVTNFRVSPISGAAETAIVNILITGDPTNAYT